MNRDQRTHWLPGLVDLLTRRPDLAGVGVTAATHVVTS